MKKSIFIIALILMGFGIKAVAGNPDVCYVKTADKVYFGQDLKMGLLTTKIVSADGTITKVKTNEVKSYMHDNRLFELMPLICEEGDTMCYDFMEYLTSRSGLKLYRYRCCMNCDVRYGYFVFKDDKLHLRVNLMNAEAVLPFFGIKPLKVC